MYMYIDIYSYNKKNVPLSVEAGKSLLWKCL